MTSIVRRLLVAGVAAGMLAAPAARANHTCNHAVVVYGYTSAFMQVDDIDLTVGGVNPNGVRCMLTADDSRDLHVIEPGANAIRVRYTIDLGPSVTELDAVVSSPELFSEPLQVTLTRTLSTLGAGVYDSALIPISAAANGCITATVHLPDGTGATDSYRTLNGFCG